MSEPPKAFVDPIEGSMALDPHPFDHFLIEVVQQLFPRLPLALGDLDLQILL